MCHNQTEAVCSPAISFSFASFKVSCWWRLHLHWQLLLSDCKSCYVLWYRAGPGKTTKLGSLLSPCALWGLACARQASVELWSLHFSAILVTLASTTAHLSYLGAFFRIHKTSTTFHRWPVSDCCFSAQFVGASNQFYLPILISLTLKPVVKVLFSSRIRPDGI